MLKRFDPLLPLLALFFLTVMNVTALRAAEFLGFGMLGTAGELLSVEKTCSRIPLTLSDDALLPLSSSLLSLQRTR